MGGDTAHELLAQLLQFVNSLASARRGWLRTRAGIDASLRALLITRAVQYRRAASEIGSDAQSRSRGLFSARDSWPKWPKSMLPMTKRSMAYWERAECYTLTCFRDAFDAGLPAPRRCDGQAALRTGTCRPG
jgi:hypothetical protein